MSFASSDVAAIKWSLLTCLLALLSAYALLSDSSRFERTSRQQLAHARQQQAALHRQLAEIQSDLKNMTAFQNEYRTLVARKVIGAEPRSDWIEGLERLRAQKLVPEFHYTIAPQQPYAPNPPLANGNFTLYLSTMNLHIAMLHEEQLLRLLTAIDDEVPGWFLLDGCRLMRNAPQAEEATPLVADCVGGWFTMKNETAP